jgi:NAD kinase
MANVNDRKAVLVIRKTRLEELTERFNTVNQAKFYIEHAGADFRDYLVEHERYKKAVEDVQSMLGRQTRLQTLERTYLPNYIFARDDAVVVLGQDGLVANTMKYLQGQPIVAINPDPDRWDGVLLPFKVNDVQAIIRSVFSGKIKVKEITIARASMNDGQVLYAVNDFFIGRKTHVSARYEIQWEKKKEDQSSSGIIVSTGLGSTGWLKSLLAGARGIEATFMEEAAIPEALDGFAWDSPYLCFTVREPFPSRSSQASVVFGKIASGKPLKIVSKMPDNGVIFSDGIEADFLAFNSGAIVSIGAADKKGLLVV